MLKFSLNILLLLVVPGSVWSQNKDNEECRSLYNQEKFEESYQCYAKDKDQIFSVYMAAYLAEFLEKKKEFKKHYKHLLSDEFKSPNQFYYAANLYPKNSKKHLKLLNKGLKKFTADTLLLRSKIEYFIKIEDYDEAIISAEQYGAQVSDMYFNTTAGDIFRMQEKYQLAIPFYKKALEIEANDLHSNYWIGMIYHDQASSMLLQIGNVEAEKDKLEKEAVSLLKKALPYLEKAYEQDAVNKDLKSALLTCYKRLGMELEYNMLRDL